MTEDGWNDDDAAAVRAAHIGVAIGRTGIDVTKEGLDPARVVDHLTGEAPDVRDEAVQLPS